MSAGTVIFPGLGPGLGGTIDPFDPDFEKKVLVAKNQAAVDKYNTDEAAKYLSHAAQIKAENKGNAAAHVPLLTIDPPPHKHGLSADGLTEITLTDLVTAPVSVLPDPDTGDTGLASGIVPVLPDKLDRVTAMLMAMNGKLDRLIAKTGA